jgi:hypothetical protein
VAQESAGPRIAQRKSKDAKNCKTAKQGNTLFVGDDAVELIQSQYEQDRVLASLPFA